MKRNRLFFIVLMFAFLSSACAHLQKPVSAENGRNVIQTTASDFKFEPNNIATRAGDAVTFNILNKSGTTHNFTLTRPDGSTMRSVDIPPKQSIDVTVDFPEPGIYKFHCDKDLHAELGMKGQVAAIER